MSRDAVFRSWWNPKAAYYRKMEKIPDEIGTAANVQAMVFGNMGDTSATGVGFTRDPGHRRKGFLRRIPDQRAGRRRGRRHPHAAADFRARKSDARRPTRSSAKSPRNLEKHYKRHAGFRVHHRRRQAVHAADPQRQAHRPGRRARRGRDGGRRHDRRRRKPSCACSRSSSISFCIRSSMPKSLKELKLLATGIDASPGAAVGRAAFTAEDAVELGKIRPRHSGPQRNHARRYSRHGRRQGHSDRGRRQVEPRGGGRARHGTPLRRRRGRHQHSANKASSSPSPSAARPSR